VTAFDGALRARVVANLDSFERRPLDDPGLAGAAVAAVLLPDRAGRACFLLTRRATRLRAHAGQWALPGGRVDAGEDPVDAALRELHEELGAHLGRESVLGKLDDYPTRSGYVITPVVCWAGEAPRLEPNPSEVSVVHLVPLEELDRPDSPRMLAIPESDRPVLQLLLWDGVIHAPTAAVLYQLREVAVHGRATGGAHFDQPVFAWR
jgi:8-oxo-dGTP pyrophosphatase MutT (NUDIX family)